MAVSLHTHSWYSLLEGVSSLDDLLAQASAGGHTALALTDTNNLYGAVPFVEKAFQYGVRPLLGACLRQDRAHCVALAMDHGGYRSLCWLITQLQLQASPPRQKPEEDAPTQVSHSLADLLRARNDGLHILVDDVPLAECLHEALGKRLWLEIIRPRPEGPKHEQALLACGKRLGLRAVASTAVHMATAPDHPTYRLATAIRQRTLLDRIPATLPITPEHRLLSVTQLRERFRDLPQAARNSERLADLLRSDVLPRDQVLPRPRMPRGRANDPTACNEYLRQLCEKGLRWRDLGVRLEARQRLREELTIIEAAGLSGYFLTVRDIARHARKHGHSMALRGSAGSSLICYLLGITDVDPLHFGLSLERFLHPGRVDLPDIDLDFDWKVRDEAIAHVIRRHGAAHAAQISSHLFLQPRSAFRESSRIHGLSDEQISELLTTFDREMDALLATAGEKARSALDAREAARDNPVHGSGRGALDLPPVPRVFPLEPQRWPRILADACRLLGRPHHLSIHPGGVVITPGPLQEHVPLQRAAKGVLITQYDKDGVEQVGLVKIDLLGNRSLATVDEARAHVYRREKIDVCDLALRQETDAATVGLLQRGDTLGVGQMESPAMRHLLIQMRPRGLGDVIQALALLRPGAAYPSLGEGGVPIRTKEIFIRRRRGLEPTRLADPRLADLLGETHGIMIYEDDALRLLQALTGLPAPDADRFRKRVVKHRTEEEADLLKKEFFDLCRRRNLAEGAVAEVWSQLVKLNRYSFCKSHAVSYGLIAWKSAYAKVHQPLAFWTAALNNNQGLYPRRVYIEAIKQAGMAIRLPCVNRSADIFTLEEDAIRVGLGAITSLPAELRSRLLNEREKHGPYRSLADLRRRLEPGSETLALLIRSGSLDCLGQSRPGLFLEADMQDRGKRRAPGPDLFDDQPLAGWTPPEYDLKRRLEDEWQTLGFVLGAPLAAIFRPRKIPAGPVVISSRDLASHLGRLVRVWGLVATLRYAITTNDRTIQFVTLEDEHGLSDITLFGGSSEQLPHLTMGPYLATGTVEEQHGVFSLTARRLEPLFPPC